METFHIPKHIPVARGSDYVLCEARCTLVPNRWQVSFCTYTAPKPPSWVVSVCLRQHNPRRNWCQTFCQVISLGNHIASRCNTRRAWWGLWLAPLLSRCPGTPGDAPLAAWDHQHGVALLARPGLCYLSLQRWVYRAPALWSCWQGEHRINRYVCRMGTFGYGSCLARSTTGRMTLPYCPKGEKPYMRKSKRQGWPPRGHQRSVKILFQHQTLLHILKKHFKLYFSNALSFGAPA